MSEPTGEAKTAATVTIAVASDLHCFSNSDPDRQQRGWTTPSYACADTSPPSFQGEPIGDLERLLQATPSIRAHLLLCPGDMSDHASPTGIKYAWEKLTVLARRLGAIGPLATAGNHDINYTLPDPVDYLKNLEPLFPTTDNAKRDKYWADHYAVVEGEHYRLILLNSSAHHHNLESPERNHGRITDTTLNRLRETLNGLRRKPVQLVLCHHHPHQHSELNLGEADVMVKGQALLDLLSQYGNWLVVHGHKHHPRITHAAGGSSAPWVFAAGSLAAYPFPAAPGHARNQFYLIQFDTNTFTQVGWGGRIQAWDWAAEVGWKKAGPGSGVPAEAGFGFLGDLALLGKQIVTELPPRQAGYRTWNELALQLPQLQRLCPRDVQELNNHGLEIEFDDSGVPYQIARKP